MGHSAWYAIYSKPHKENQLHAYLRAQGLESFYPVIRTTPANPRSPAVRPYFPRYLFVHIDIEELSISTISGAHGASHIVEFDGCLAEVPEQVIQELRQRIQEIEAKNVLAGHSELKPGDRIQILKGPLAGYEGIFDTQLTGDERVQILLKVLGQSVKTSVKRRNLKVLARPLP